MCMSGPSTRALSVHLPVTTMSAPRSRALWIGPPLKHARYVGHAIWEATHLDQFNNLLCTQRETDFRYIYKSRCGIQEVYIYIYIWLRLFVLAFKVDSIFGTNMRLIVWLEPLFGSKCSHMILLQLLVVSCSVGT